MKKTGLTAAIAAAFTAAESTLSGNEADHDGDTSNNTGDEQ